MPSVIGRMMATLGLDSSDFKSGMRDAGGDIDSFTGKATSGGVLVGGAMAAMGAAAVVGIGMAIKSAAGFEQAIDQVGAITGATEKQMNALGDAALRIGKDTAFSAGEAAQAMQILAANGLTVDQILNGAADATVALAAAGGVDLKIAADVASTSMKVWGLSGEQMIDVVNRIAGAANVSRFGVEDMSQAIAMGGGVAAAFGVDFQEFTTAIAASADLFSSGSDAGTSFKTMLQRMVSPAGQGADAIAMLGLSFHNANGELKSLPEIAGMLNKTFATMAPKDRDKLMSDIFGTDGIRAAIGLMRTGEQGFKDMSDAMGKTDAAAIAKVRMGNFNGALEQLKGTIEVLAIVLGREFLPALTAAALWLADNLPAATATAERALRAFMGPIAEIARTVLDVLVPALAPLVDTLATFLEPLVTSQPALIAFGIIIGTVMVLAFVALGVAIAAIVGPMLLAIAAFAAVAIAWGALIAGIVLLIKYWDDITAKVPILGVVVDAVASVTTKAFGKIVDGVMLLVDWFDNHLLQSLIDIEDSVAHLTGFIIDHWDQIQAVTEVVWGFIEVYLTSIWDTFTAVFEAALMILVNVVETGFAEIGVVIESALLVISGILDVFVGLFTGDWDRMWDGVKRIVEGVWVLIEGTFTNALDSLQSMLEIFGDLVRNLWQAVWDAIAGYTTEVWDLIGGTVMDAVGGIQNGIEAAWNFVESITSAVWNSITGVIEQKVAAIAASIDAAWGGISAATEAVWNVIKAVIDFVWDAIGDKVMRSLGTIHDAIDTQFNLIKAVTEAVWEAIRSVIEVVWNAIDSVIRSVLGGIISFIDDRWNTIRSTTESVWNAISSVISTIWYGIQQVTDSVSGAIQYSIETAWNAILSVTGTVWNEIRGTVEAAFNGLLYFLQGAGWMLEHAVLQPFWTARDAIWGIFEGINNNVRGGLSWVMNTIGSFVNGFGDGVNWISNAIGLGPLIGKWNVPGFASGGVAPGGMAMVGEHGPELAYLPKGAEIFPAFKTTQMLEAIAGDRAIGGWGFDDAFDAAKSAAASVGGAVRDTIKKFISMGASKLIDTAMSAVGFAVPDLPGVFKKIPGKVWDMLLGKLVSVVTDWLSGADAGLPKATGSLGNPLGGGYYVSQEFGMTPDALAGAYGGGPHTGIDLAANYGTPILAADGGFVGFAGMNGGYGNYVNIISDAMMTAYGHMASIAVASGQQVEKGQTIGYVDSTGYSTGNHLHFEVYSDGVLRNPRDFVALARGTRWHRGGAALIGDNGPELVSDLPPGARVFNNQDTMGMLGGKGDVHVHNEGDIHIYANDEADARATLREYSYRMGMALKARGI